MTDVFSESWGVDNIKPKYSNGKISGFEGSVFTKDKKGKKINTGIAVQSGYILTNEGKNAKTDNIWVSKEYKSSIE